MARKRKTSKRRAISPVVKARTRRSGASNGASPMKSMGYGFGYGIVRAPALSLMSPILNQFDLGNYEASAAMGVISYFAVKNGSGMIRELGKAGLYVESAAVGAAMNPLGQVTTQIANLI